MVDIDSALRASAYSGKKNRKSGENNKDEKKKGLEPFDPRVHATKELADAYSMWLVIIYGFLISILMRYVFMPTQDSLESIMWLLPVMMTLTVPSLHKILIPKKYSELYTRGNWFRGGFLFIFSWLALSFILLNPPLADIASPTVASGIDIQDNDDEAIIGYSWDNDIYEINLKEDATEIVLGMAIRDNVDVENARILVKLNHNSLPESIILANGTVINQNEAINKFNSVGQWLRGEDKNIEKEFTGEPDVAPNSEDIGLAWNLAEELGKDNINLGEYTITIEIKEDGDHVKPFGENTWEKTYKLKITQTESSD
ncbi:MAG: hypothetical protein ACKVI6_05105 [Candidatus Poseidoniales archaeon]|jgi:hypothetical protein|tara:strand:- start:8860 stop:9801 length:942 start_codon:yes stop_codon:yes gene_type:complete